MLPASRLVAMITPRTVAAASTTTGYIDTKGYDFATINLVTQTQAVTDVPTVLRLSESDTAPTAFTDGTVITTFVGGTATSTSVGFVIPTPRTTTSIGVDTYAVQMNVDLRSRKRYLIVQFSPLSTATLSLNANLHRGEQTPDSTTLAGVLKVVNG